MNKKLFKMSLISLLCLASCGDDGTENTSGVNYSGPGSYWTASLNPVAFSMERSENFGDPIDLTVSGSVSTLASGYKELTVASANGLNAPSIGEKAYALEIPGFFTLVKPLNSVDDKLLPMLAQGACPSNDIDFNWIVTGYEGSNNLATAADLVGVANFTHSTTTFGISKQYSLDGTDVTNVTNMPGNCSSGFMQINADADPATFEVDMWLSQSGAALVKTPEDTIIVAMPAESFSASDLQNKEFFGLVFDEASSSEKVKPIYLDVDGLGTTATGGDWSDVVANTKGAAGAQISFSSFDSPSTGFVQADLAVDADMNGSFETPGGNMICQYKSNIASSGKDMLFCAGHAPGDTTNMFNVLLITK